MFPHARDLLFVLPGTTPQQYMLAVANRERQWIQEFAIPSFTDSALSCLPQQSNVSEHLRDLEYYTQMIPFLVPGVESLSTSVLWHPNLHANNIMVVEKKRTDDGMRQFDIVSILDWQNAWAGPMFLQLDVPDFLQWSDALSPLHDIDLPRDPKDKDESDQKQLQDEHKRALIHRYYRLGPFLLNWFVPVGALLYSSMLEIHCVADGAYWMFVQDGIAIP